MRVDENVLYGIPLPQETETYIPIANREVISLIREIANGGGYLEKNSVFNMAREGNVMSGVINFNGFDPDMGLSIGVLNSYDKSKKLSIGVGSSVFVCTNGMFKADLMEVRKHTGSVQQDLVTIIQQQVSLMQLEYDSLVGFKYKLQEHSINRIEVSHMLGEMFYEDDIIKPTQMSVIKKQMNASTFGITGEQVSLWKVYNWVTESLKAEHPSTFLDSHVKFHNYFDRKIKKYV